jgi:hypothetical protein
MPALIFWFHIHCKRKRACTPLCDLSRNIINHSTKTSLHKRHFETKHGDLKRKPLEYFQRKLSDLSASKGQITSFSGVNMKAVEVSYKVTLRIDKTGKSHTTGESLLPQAVKDMASKVKEQLTAKFKASKYYSIQLDESTAASSTAHLLTFIRFEEEESVKQELLFCEPLLGRATSNDIFKKLVQFMKIRGTEWKKKMCRSLLRCITCNGGETQRVVAQIKEVAPNAKFVD